MSLGFAKALARPEKNATDKRRDRDGGNWDRCPRHPQYKPAKADRPPMGNCWTCREIWQKKRDKW